MDVPRGPEDWAHLDRAAQLRYGATIFGAFVIGAVAAGWLMLLFPL